MGLRGASAPPSYVYIPVYFLIRYAALVNNDIMHYKYITNDLINYVAEYV
jgi:hypothetical protein